MSEAPGGNGWLEAIRTDVRNNGRRADQADARMDRLEARIESLPLLLNQVTQLLQAVNDLQAWRDVQRNQQIALGGQERVGESASRSTMVAVVAIMVTVAFAVGTIAIGLLYLILKGGH